MIYLSSLAAVVVVGLVCVANQIDKLADAIQQVRS